MAKVVGTVTCVAGATVMALSKGQKLLNSTDFKTLILTSFLQAAGDRWLLGFFFLLAASCCWSAWLILQVPIGRNHLDPLSCSTWLSVLSTAQTAVLALFIEPDRRVWGAGSGLELLACFYSGLGCAISYFVQSWCISIRGPLFSAMFSPLCTVFTTAAAAFFLHEELYLGSLVGAVAIVAGLYIVLWGKAIDINGYNEKSQANDNDANITILEEKQEKLSENNLEEPLIHSLNEHC